MGLTYFKRYRLEIDLTGRDLLWPVLPSGYRMWAWDPSLLDAHAEAKFYSFCDELDSNVFPCLGEQDGCRRLMAEIVRKPGFLPEATWLMVHTDPLTHEHEYCGTIQGIRDQAGLGAVQNLGVVAEHRNRGLGTCLLFQSLQGFRHAGVNRIYLEVTSENQSALRLYRRRGFTTVRTVFKAAEVLVS